MNKLIISILCFLITCSLWSLTVCSQNPSSESDKLQRIFTLQELIGQSFEQGTHQKTIDYLLESISLFNQLDENEKNNNEYLLRGDYYNLTCAYSLTKNKKKAIEAFEKAIENGYTSYAHALHDSDLDFIRKDKKYLQLMEQIREFGDYLYILKKDEGYEKENRNELPEFVYEPMDNWRIRNVRNAFNLDSVAGNGDDISRIIRVMEWVHNTIPHNGNHWPPCEIDAYDIYNYSKANNNQGVNCRALAIVLNECYLSLGIPSRFITCFPKDKNDQDCHVINSVYSETLQKWLWMDPSFNAYVKDDQGNYLSIEEVRERLIKDEPVFLNEDANWNNQNPQTKEYYIDQYMAKNLYWFQCPARSIFNVETNYRNTNEQYVSLIPLTYEKEDQWKNNLNTHDPAYFWQKPDVSK